MSRRSGRDPNAPSAFERARLAYEVMKRQQLDAALERRLRERARAVRIMVLLGTTMMLLIGVTIYGGWLPESLRFVSDPVTAEGRSFRETRTGHVRSVVRGNTCRDLKFSNADGRYIGGSYVDCETESQREPVPAVPKGSPLTSIRDAFSNR